jgi:hypothetical protein
MTCCMHDDPASPTSMKGYVVAFTVFYDQGFNVPSD